jgi:iron complex transport system ATP-binding protein
MIEVKNATKRYGTTTVVDDVSLEIHKGGITSLIGPNGAGKSTLLGMMSRLLKMDGGSVAIDGLDITTTAGDVMAKKLSILRQSNRFEARLTVEDLVMFGRLPYCKGRPTIGDKEHVDRSIRYLELDNLRHRYLDQLSGGQQ